MSESLDVRMPNDGLRRGAQGHSQQNVLFGSKTVLQPGSPRNLCRSSVCYETSVMVC